MYDNGASLAYEILPSKLCSLDSIFRVDYFVLWSKSISKNIKRDGVDSLKLVKNFVHKN